MTVVRDIMQSDLSTSIKEQAFIMMNEIFFSFCAASLAKCFFIGSYYLKTRQSTHTTSLANHRLRFPAELSRLFLNAKGHQ